MSSPPRSILPDLERVIAQRKAQADPGKSYVAKLMYGGVEAVNAKVLEEAGEVVEASREPGEDGRAHLVREVADLVFHALVLLSIRDVAWADVEAEFGRRFGIGGLGEKAARGRIGPTAEEASP